MIDINYANAYSEVLEILKYIPQEDYNKIPKEKIDFYEKNANKDYVFNYDINKTLDEQNVSKIAKGVIAILFRDYWATEIQKEKIIIKQKKDRKLLEEKKKEKYNVDKIFENDTKKNESENLIVNIEVIEDKRWYKKIWQRFLNFFKK